jgi:hypothetical protein
MIKLKYLVPNGVEKTWEPKGAKHVQMLGFEYKRQIIMVISSMLQGVYFHHRLCLLPLYPKHFQQTTKERQIASKGVGTSHLVKTVLVVLGNNQ